MKIYDSFVRQCKYTIYALDRTNESPICVPNKRVPNLTIIEYK